MSDDQNKNVVDSDSDDYDERISLYKAAEKLALSAQEIDSGTLKVKRPSISQLQTGIASLESQKGSSVPGMRMKKVFFVDE